MKEVQRTTPCQHNGIESLIARNSIRNTAKHAQVGERTLYRELQEEEFQNRSGARRWPTRNPRQEKRMRLKALLRQNDGLAGGRIWLGSVVKNVQLGLIQAGHPMTADGKFGPGTANAVKAFQRNHGVAETARVDRSTWSALEDDLEAATGAEAA